MEKLIIPYPVIVEGKYDKIKLDSILDARIIVTDGFGVFSDSEKKNLFRRLAEKEKLIVVTDSDGAGLVIRNFFNSVIPKDRLIHIYIPQVAGKEKRKTVPSAEGFLGVEGSDADILRKLFQPFSSGAGSSLIRTRPITKADLYSHGLCGAKDSSEARLSLMRKLDLPSNLSSNAFLDAVNLLYSFDEFERLF